MSNIRPFEGLCPRIDPEAWIDPTALVIGDVALGPRASVWPMSVIRGDIHRIVIGAGTNIQDGSVLHVSHDSRFMPGGAPLIIGERVTVGHQALLHGCQIGDLCLIGSGARVLDRVVIPAHTMLGAGTLVTPGQVLEGGNLYVGAPARRARALKDSELEYLEYSAANYMRLAARHAAGAPAGPGSGVV